MNLRLMSHQSKNPLLRIRLWKSLRLRSLLWWSHQFRSPKLTIPQLKIRLWKNLRLRSLLS
jgi:hypothetical protein